MSEHKTTHVCTVAANRIKAALQTAADGDTRFYLNGILFDTERKTLVGCDGHCAAILGEEFEPQTEPVPPFIVPRDALERVCKLADRYTTGIQVSIECKEKAEGDVTAKRRITLRAAGGSVDIIEVDGIYPDYARIVPTEFSGVAGQYDPRVMARVCEAARLAADKKKTELPHLSISYNGAEKAGVLAYEDPTFLAVVMPWRQGDYSAFALERLGFKPAAQETPDRKAA